MVSNVSWLDLKHILRKITVSYDPNEVYNFEDEFIKSENPDETLLLFNNSKGITEFMSMVNNHVKKVFSEIEQNEQSKWDIHEKEDYLITFSTFINHLNAQCLYDESTNTYSCENVIISEPLKNPNLHKFFLIDIENLPRELMARYFEINKKLKSLPDYESIINKNRKSTFGNKRIEWKLQLNKLVDFYLRQIEFGLIETDVVNLKDFLINNYTFKGKSISENTINTYIDPNKRFEKLPKEHKKLNPKDFI